MDCPKCGHKIEEGYLYCSVCGEEIHMVPDFEPEIEDSMHKMLSNVAGDVQYTPDDGEEKEAVRKSEKSVFYRKVAAAIAGMSVVLIVTLSVFGIWYFKTHSVQYHISKAEKCVAVKEFEQACSYYEKALQLDDDNCSVRFRLAELYYAMGRESDAILYLKEITWKESASYEELENAYSKLIGIYIQKEEFDAINQLLEECKNEDIRQEFQEFQACPPVFSYATGTYEEVIPLKLSSNTAGTIYYTLDGSIPNEQSMVYTEPIYLESGSYDVNAVFVNENGVKSTMAGNSYYIDVEIPNAPEISAYSGDYEFPVMIQAEASPDCMIYYSADREEPYIRYTQPIPMPIGKTEMNFVAVNKSGVYSQTVTRNYNLRLHTEITPLDARQIVIETMLQMGYINDEKGNIWENQTRKIYDYRFVVAIKDKSDYYIIEETYLNENNQKISSELKWAVDVYSGECFRLTTDEEGTFQVEKF